MKYRYVVVLVIDECSFINSGGEGETDNKQCYFSTSKVNS